MILQTSELTFCSTIYSTISFFKEIFIFILKNELCNIVLTYAIKEGKTDAKSGIVM